MLKSVLCIALLAVSATAAPLDTATTTSSAQQVSLITQCPPLAPRTSPPKNIKDLRVDDIKGVMVLGDSILSGFVALGPGPGGANSLNEDRGYSALGGDAVYPYYLSPGFAAGDPVRTFPNFIKQFNPNITGQQTLIHPVELCDESQTTNCGKYYPTDALSGSQSGMIAYDLPTYGVPHLISQINGPYASVKNEWKVLAIQIGSNDLCASCTQSGDAANHTAQVYYNYLSQTLEMVRQNIPKTLVVFAGSIDVQQVFGFAEANMNCPRNSALVGSINPIFGTSECGCAFEPADQVGNPSGRTQMHSNYLAYNTMAKKLVAHYQKLNQADFNVIFEPALSGIQFNTFDQDFLSQVDCFHRKYSENE